VGTDSVRYAASRPGMVAPRRTPRPSLKADPVVKTLTATAGGVLSVLAAVGIPAVLGVAGLAVFIIGMLCWIVSNRSRTENAVALITATRRATDEANSTGRRLQRRRQ
jgi:hypothetical protein